jgi:hypothetical protein
MIKSYKVLKLENFNQKIKLNYFCFSPFNFLILYNILLNVNKINQNQEK